MKTIRQQLLVGLLYGTLACALVASAALYSEVREEANELADLQLRQIVAALPNQLASSAELPVNRNPDEDIVIQAWDQGNRILYSSHPQLHLVRSGSDGFNSVTLHGARWRVYGEQRRGHYLQVAQPMAVRELLAADLTWRIALPLLIFLGVLGALISVVVGRALRPLERVAEAVAGRSASALHALELDGLPPELSPIVDALNDLLGKIDRAMTAQRNFVADAAHELRSPLTALKLQLQLAERAGSDALRMGAFAKLHDRLDRASHLVHQLLTLARHESGHGAARFGAIDLLLLAQSTVADQSTLAENRGIDLGVEADSQSVLVQAEGDALRVLLNNLVDNALRYTQAGGQVDVFSGFEGVRPVLRVRDNGPGVSEPERLRLFDRFYRPAGNAVWGCGLGLSIVKNIADLHSAEVRLADNAGATGFMVTIVFPAQ